MPPLRGDGEVVRRFTPYDEVRRNDVALLETDSPGWTFHQSQEAFQRGALGVISQVPCIPWDGRFGLTVSSLPCARQKLLAHQWQNFTGSILVIGDGPREAQLRRLVARGISLAEAGGLEDLTQTENPGQSLLALSANTRWIVADVETVEKLLPRPSERKCDLLIISPQTELGSALWERRLRMVRAGGCLLAPHVAETAGSAAWIERTKACSSPGNSVDVLDYGTAAPAQFRVKRAGPSGVEVSALGTVISVSRSTPWTMLDIVAAVAAWRMIFSEIDLVKRIVNRVITESSAEGAQRTAG
jgi:hypothetical protein